MGMSADEELWRIGFQRFFYGRIITWGIAADMGHENLYAFRLPAQFFRIIASDIRSIDIPVYSPQWFEGGQPFCERYRPKVTGVPDLITFFEMPENILIQKMMGVGKQTYLQHGQDILIGVVQDLLKDVFVILEEIFMIQVEENKIAYPVVRMPVNLVYHFEQMVG